MHSAVQNIQLAEQRAGIEMNLSQKMLNTLSMLSHSADTYMLGDDVLRNRPEFEEYFSTVTEIMDALSDHFANSSNPEDIQFIFDAQHDVDTTLIEYEGFQSHAVKVFSYEHAVLRNPTLLPGIMKHLTSEPSAVAILGNMYSAKTELLIGLIQMLMAHFHSYEVFVFEYMEEEFLHSRVLRPEQKVPAIKKSLNKLMHAVETYEPPVNGHIHGHPTHLIVLEEFSFSGGTPEDQTLLNEIVDQGNAKGISFIFCGLKANFKDELLPLAQTLKDREDVMKQDLSSFRIKEVAGTKTYEVADTTARYFLNSFFHYGSEVLIPREIAFGLNYAPCPARAHPYNVLKMLGREDLIARLDAFPFKAQLHDAFVDAFYREEKATALAEREAKKAQEQLLSVEA